MLFLQYKTHTKIISLPDSLSKLINDVKIMFPSLKQFKIEYESNGQKQLIDSDEVFSQVLEKMKNGFQATKKFFVTKVEDNSMTEVSVEAISGEMTAHETEKPKTRKEIMKERIEKLKNTLDEKICDLGKDFDQRISKLDEKNRKKVEKAIELRDRALQKGAELSEKLEKKIRMIVV